MRFHPYFAALAASAFFFTTSGVAVAGPNSVNGMGLSDNPSGSGLTWVVQDADGDGLPESIQFTDGGDVIQFPLNPGQQITIQPNGGLPPVAVTVIVGTTGGDTISEPQLTTPCIIFGGGGADNIVGGQGADYIDGGGGDDTIDGGPGDDRLDGGTGDDDMDGGDGHDNVDGEAGDDNIAGGGGGDNLFGGDGHDRIRGDNPPGPGEVWDTEADGDDALDGGAGDDTLYGTGTGEDFFDGGAGSDSYPEPDGEDDDYYESAESPAEPDDIHADTGDDVRPGAGDTVYWE